MEKELSTVEDEANQSAKEFGASFRGDPVEALEEVQAYLSEISAKALPGFAGGLVAIAGAAGIGAVLAGYEKWKERQEEIKQNAQELRNTLVDVGGVIDENTRKTMVQNALSELTNEEYRKLYDAAVILGLSQEDINSLLLGEIALQDDALERRRETGRQLSDILGAQEAVRDVTRDNRAAWQDTADTLRSSVRYEIGQIAEAIRNLPNTHTIRIDADVINAEAKIQGVVNKLATLEARLAE